MAFARMAGQRRRALEFGARLREPAEPLEEIRPNTRQQGVVSERRLADQPVDKLQSLRRAPADLTGLTRPSFLRRIKVAGIDTAF